MKKIINPWKGMEGYNCFGCAPNNEAGVKMEFYEDGDEVISIWKPQPQFQGWIDTLHGGIQAVLLDEICAWVVLWTIPLAYIGSQAGWVVAEVGRQPWAIQDMLPVGAAISKLQTGSVQLTFFIFLLLFTVLLFAEIGIMLKAIKKGPEGIKN